MGDESKHDRAGSASRAEVVHYYHYDEDCSSGLSRLRVGGNRRRGRQNFHEELFDLCCPRCGKMLLIVSCVLDVALVKREAALGNARALRDLPIAQLVERYLRQSEDRKPPECPRCGSRGVEILYGFPDLPGLELVERGELIWGGCMFGDPGSPKWACRECDTRWGRMMNAPGTSGS